MSLAVLFIANLSALVNTLLWSIADNREISWSYVLIDGCVAEEI
jgi:hypothetical protein